LMMFKRGYRGSEITTSDELSNKKQVTMGEEVQNRTHVITLKRRIQMALGNLTKVKLGVRRKEN